MFIKPTQKEIDCDNERPFSHQMSIHFIETSSNVKYYHHLYRTGYTFAHTTGCCDLSINCVSRPRPASFLFLHFNSHHLRCLSSLPVICQTSLSADLCCGSKHLISTWTILLRWQSARKELGCMNPLILELLNVFAG